MPDIKNKITLAAGKASLGLKKRSPEILLASGIIFSGAAIFMSVKSTLKAGEVIDKHKEKMDQIHEALELKTDDYTLEDSKKDTVKAYVQTGWEFAKLYAPTIIFSALSLTLILSSHGIIKKRNAALAASLASVRTAFDEYRGRVVRDLGKEMDNHFLYDTVEKVAEVETVDENGKKKKIKEKYQVPTKSSVYSRFFDETNPNWEKDGSANYLFVRSQMIYLQKKLQANGYLFLNDVYKQLDLPITIAGQSAGWIYDFDNKDNSLIYFEGFDIDGDETNLSGAVRALKNGYEWSVLLDFKNIKDNILEDVKRVDSSIDEI